MTNSQDNNKEWWEDEFDIVNLEIVAIGNSKFSVDSINSEIQHYRTVVKSLFRKLLQTQHQSICEILEKEVEFLMKNPSKEVDVAIQVLTLTINKIKNARR